MGPPESLRSLGFWLYSISMISNIPTDPWRWWDWVRGSRPRPIASGQGGARPLVPAAQTWGHFCISCISGIAVPVQVGRASTVPEPPPLLSAVFLGFLGLVELLDIP